MASARGGLSVEEERDLYREKVNNLKLLVKKLRQDQSSNDAQLRGAETIAELLKDSRRENQQLLTDNAELQKSVHVLQQRLVSIGASPQLTTQEGDSMNPGPSRQLLDNLIEDNVRLKELMKYSNCEPERLEELTREVHRLQQRLEEVIEENTVLQAEKDSLSSVLAAADNEKDLEIVRLRMCLAAHEKNKDTSDVLCQSLVDETSELKHKLQAAGEMCQQLAQSLQLAIRKRSAAVTDSWTQVDEAEVTLGSSSPHTMSPVLTNPQSPDHFTAIKSQLSSGSGSSDDSVQLVVLSQKLIVLEEQNNTYKAQLQKVIEHNNQWQQYNSEREQYVKRIQLQLVSAQEQLAAGSAAGTPGQLSDREQQQKDVDQILMTAKQRLDEKDEEKQELEEEIRRLRLDLQKALEDAAVLEVEQTQQKPLSHSPALNQDYQDKIQMLQAQVQIFSEDFKSERKDRERAQARCSELEVELRFYKQQVDSLQTRSCYESVLKRQEMLDKYEREYEQNKRQDPTRQKTYNFARTTAEPERDRYAQLEQFPRYDMSMHDLEEDTDIIDSLPDSYSSQSVRSDALECSMCNAQFPLSNHEELLEHLENVHGTGGGVDG